MIGFEEVIRNGSLILTDGGIETRVMFETDVPLPEHVGVAALAGDPVGGPVLRRTTRATSPPPGRSACR